MSVGRTRITRIRVSNYRSIGREQVIPLGSMTVLVGPNGSGKSHVLDVLGFVRDAMHRGLSNAITDRGGITSVRHSRSRAGHLRGASIRIDAVLGGDRDGRRASYGFEVAGDGTGEYRVESEDASVTIEGREVRFRVDRGTWSGPRGLAPRVHEKALVLPVLGGDERFQELFDLLSTPVIYSIRPEGMRRPQRHGPQEPLHRHGDNWACVLRMQDSATWKQELVASLRRLTGDIDDVKVTKAASYLVARFRHGPEGQGEWFDADHESDGTLRMAGILLALLQDPSLPLVGIEEPELTVHPGALPLIMDHLRQASATSQVMVTTHSPELLDLVDADEVCVVERRDGETMFGAMAEDQREAVRRGLLRLGELMASEGIRRHRLTPEDPMIDPT